MATEKGVISKLYTHLSGFQQICAYNGFYPPDYLPTPVGIEFDLIVVTRAYYVQEYEVKLSLSDFRADKKKIEKHEFIKAGIYPAVFSYVIPIEIQDKIELPEHCGLITFCPHSDYDNYTTFSVVKKPYSKSKKSIDKDDLIRILKNQSIRGFRSLKKGQKDG